MRSNRLVGLCLAIAILVGALSFNVIVGVFGIVWAVVGLVAFLVGAVVICRAYPGEATKS